MLNITNPWGTANQNHTELSLQTCEAACHQKDKSSDEDVEKGDALYIWWEYKLVRTLWQILWRFLKKFIVKLLYNPVIPLLGTHPKKIKSVCQKDINTSTFIVVLVTITKAWKQPKYVSTDEWIV